MQIGNKREIQYKRFKKKNETATQDTAARIFT